MSTRNPEKELMKNLKDFETYVKMADSAIKSAKPKLKKLIEIKNKLETSYFNLNQSFHFYKLDVIAKECKTEVAFNGKKRRIQEKIPTNTMILGRIPSLPSSLKPQSTLRIKLTNWKEWRKRVLR